MAVREKDTRMRSGEATTAADGFDVLWTELVRMLGTTATATLVRRAAKRAAERAPDLEGLQILREGWEYRYILPAEWRGAKAAAVPAFLELVYSELVPLLREFTGPILLRHLARLPALTELRLEKLDETR